MKYLPDSLSEEHKSLQFLLRANAPAEAVLPVFLSLHAQLHPGPVSQTQHTLADALLSGLRPCDFAVMPTAKDETLAWAIWHMARLEDLSLNLLIARREPVLSPLWSRRLGTDVTDTGNAMTDEEILSFSRAVSPDVLLEYWTAVGRRTREVVQTLTAQDWRRPADADGLARIRETGGVTDQPASTFLVDYWAKKDVAGLLLMPLTRDPMMHLNDCMRLKESLRTKKNFFLQ